QQELLHQPASLFAQGDEIGAPGLLLPEDQVRRVIPADLRHDRLSPAAGALGESADVGHGSLRRAIAITVYHVLVHAGKSQLAFEGYVIGMNRDDQSLRREAQSRPERVRRSPGEIKRDDDALVSSCRAALDDKHWT